MAGGLNGECRHNFYFDLTWLAWDEFFATFATNTDQWMRCYMSDPLLRQWEMLKLIPRERKITAKELQSKLEGLGFSVTRRTLERDLERLSTPFCLESDTRSKPYGWRYALNMKSPSIPGLTASEALTLLLLQNYLKNLLPVAVADNLAAHFAAARHYFAQEHPEMRLLDWLNRVHVISPGPTLLPPEVDPRIQRTVYEAFLHDLQLSMEYLTATAADSKHYQSVHIQGLVQHGSVVYLVTMLNEHDDLRLLALHRIQSVALIHRPCRRKPEFDLQAYIQQGGFGFGDVTSTDVIELSMLFHNGAGHHLIDTPLSIQQRVEHLDAQTLKIQVELPLTPKLTWWLTSFGPDIEVLGPASLRAALAARHRRAAEYYANG